MGVLVECQCLESRKPARAPHGMGHGVHPELVVSPGGGGGAPSLNV